MLPEGLGQQFLALSQWLPAHTPNRQVIEHQQGASAQRMATIQRLTVEPFDGVAIDLDRCGT
jgi:hypothetical protein